MALRALILALFAAGGAAAISKCSAEFGGLLANDPHGDPQAFLRCQGSSGAWQRQLCPGELVFDFVNQQCTTPERKTRQPSTLNIAILNNSCGRGEQCIGGTICDPIQKKCVCPAGTTPVLETLSCEAKGGQGGFNPYNSKPEMPAAISSIFPNPAVQKFIESFFKPNQNFVAEKSGTDFKPNNNFVLNSLATTVLPTRKMVPPGSTCRDGEICAGGSVCTQPFGMCLCQGNQEAHNGECVAPTTAPTLAPYAPAPQPTLGPIAPAPIHVIKGAPVLETTTPPVPVIQSTLSYKSIPVAPVDVRTTSYTPPVKPIKIQLGGSKQAGVGVSCALNTDCMIGAYCNGNTAPATCQCLSTHVNVEGRCEKVIYPGQTGCAADSQCAAAYTGSTCVDRMCVCPAGARAIEQTCVPANEPVTSPPGGSCSEARTCTGGAVCREGWCVCPEASMIVQKGQCVVSTRTTKPAPIALSAGKKIVPGGACSARDSCVGGSSCVGGVCRCGAGAAPSDRTGRCEPIRLATAAPPPPPPASTTRPAPLPNSIVDECAAIGLYCRSNTVCINRSCQCPEGTTLHGDRCVPLDQVRSPGVAPNWRQVWRHPYATPPAINN